MENRTLFFGDNLQVIGENILDYFFDLIYLDPPFNSNRNSNVLINESQEELARALNKSRVTISDNERGRVLIEHLI